MTFAELAEGLAGRGLLSEEALSTFDPTPPAPGSPWYVQAMLGVCAWTAGLLLLAFVAIALVPKASDTDAFLLVGVFTCGAAGLLYGAVSEASVFGTQFALAMSIAGQTSLTFGLGSVGKEGLAFWGMLVVETALVFAIRNQFHRTLTSTLAVIFWALAVHASFLRDLPDIFHSTRPDAQPVLSIVFWFVIWAPVAAVAYWLVANEARWMSEGRDALFRPILHGLLAGLSIGPLVTLPAMFWVAIREAASSLTALPPVLAMLLALLALTLSFAIRNRVLMGLAIIFALLEVGGFYYVLGATLLVKSIIMVVLGIALLGTAQFLGKESA